MCATYRDAARKEKQNHVFPSSLSSLASLFVSSARSLSLSLSLSLSDHKPFRYLFLAQLEPETRKLKIETLTSYDRVSELLYRL